MAPHRSVVWSEYSYGVGCIVAGRKPAVAINDQGYLLLVFEALSEDNMMYCVGKILASGEVIWREPKQYDKGVTPTIALQSSGSYFVEVHKSQKNYNLWSHVGKFEVVGTGNPESFTEHVNVEWGPSKKYVNQETGKLPTVKFSKSNPNHVEAVHLSHKTNKTWKWEADLNTDMTLHWDVNSHVQTPEQQYKNQCVQLQQHSMMSS